MMNISTSLATSALFAYHSGCKSPAKNVAIDPPLPRQTMRLHLLSVDAGDAAEALAALQGSTRGMAPPQAPGAPSLPAQIMPGLRVPGMGRGSSLYRGVSKVSLRPLPCICL